ncbi:hypothetical protein [Burkholderia gladioli]|uniref:hypothetical protein n=1 Tax=Burkholderia gladioli TaxID=28095 RepID=UPI0011B21A79|nr:hypothetical protein [Burkholderia gladioli]MBU9276860.1 hypothetical protein [Burkholderia gladioli]
MKPIQSTSEEQAVLAPLLALLDGLRRRDREAMLAQVMPDSAATIIREGRVLHYSLRALLERELPSGEVDEQLFHPEVRIDDDIAMIWAPYKLFIDGRLHHSGTNILSLVRQSDGLWLIAGHLDNSRRSAE